MGVNWCIFNESFANIDKDLDLKQNIDKNIFYGLINGLFILGAAFGC